MASPIIVALDVRNAEQAVRMAGAVAPAVGGLKVGLELLMGPGPGVIGALHDLDLPIFVDAKLHDIPNTVARAAEQLGRWGARWVTAHAAGGRAMLEAAAEGLAKGAAGSESGILAITVLTSLTESDLAPTGITLSPGRLTAKRTRLAADSGSEGVISSVRELGVVTDVAPGLIVVCPGIRMAGADHHDQARVATPSEARRRGANAIVVGRAITTAPDPLAAAVAINEAWGPVHEHREQA
jgi:orotidine-5'-phosphate decarboxylase